MSEQKKIKEREKIENIETQSEPNYHVPTRSEPISHESETKSDPDPPSSDPSDDSSSSSDSKRKRRRIKKKSIQKDVIERNMSILTHVPKVITHRNILITDIMDSSKVPPSGGGSVPFLS